MPASRWVEAQPISAGLSPFSCSGEALTRYSKGAIADDNRQAAQFKLVRER